MDFKRLPTQGRGNEKQQQPRHLITTVNQTVSFKLPFFGVGITDYISLEEELAAHLPYGFFYSGTNLLETPAVNKGI